MLVLSIVLIDDLIPINRSVEVVKLVSLLPIVADDVTKLFVLLHQVIDFFIVLLGSHHVLVRENKEIIRFAHGLHVAMLDKVPNFSFYPGAVLPDFCVGKVMKAQAFIALIKPPQDDIVQNEVGVTHAPQAEPKELRPPADWPFSFLRLCHCNLHF